MTTIPIFPSAQPDTGTAYGRPAATHKTELTEVGAGTPMGELLRRYWHPVGLASDAGSIPRPVQVLGETLILFRDQAGRPGLVHPHCAHRGASLYYGKVEERGIRCCYHGWLFDVQGHCLDQPCEPPGNDRARSRVRQPWYPVQDLYGLVWAYLGPPDKKPLLPRYDALEVLDEGEFLETDGNSIGGGGPVVIPCNWLQHYENLVDPFHVVILHAAFSGTQFVPAMALMPQVSWDYALPPRPPLHGDRPPEGEQVNLGRPGVDLAATGVRTTSIRHLPDGTTLRRISEAALPTLRVIPSPRIGQYGRVESLGWVLPMDDHHFRIYSVGRVRAAGDLVRVRSRLNGKLWEDLSEAEHQAYPGDYEAMVSQGRMAPHSAEHLATSDRGIVMLRRLLQRQLDALREGRDPAGLIRDPSAAPLRFEAGNYLVQA